MKHNKPINANSKKVPLVRRSAFYCRSWAALNCDPSGVDRGMAANGYNSPRQPRAATEAIASIADAPNRDFNRAAVWGTRNAFPRSRPPFDACGPRPWWSGKGGANRRVPVVGRWRARSGPTTPKRGSSRRHPFGPGWTVARDRDRSGDAVSPRPSRANP